MRERKGPGRSLHEKGGPGQLCVQEEGARAALCVRGRGQGSSLRERKGLEPLCAGDEGARAALCARGRGRGSSVRKREESWKAFARDEGFLPQLFYRNITFLTFLKKVRNVRNVMLRVAVVVKKSCPELPWPLHLWLLHLVHSSVCM